MKILDLYKETHKILKSLPKHHHFLGRLFLLITPILGIYIYNQHLFSFISLSLTFIEIFVIMEYLSSNDKNLSYYSLNKPHFINHLPKLIILILLYMGAEQLLKIIEFLIIFSATGLRDNPNPFPTMFEVFLNHLTGNLLFMFLMPALELILMLPYKFSVYSLFDKTDTKQKFSLLSILKRSFHLTKGFRLKIFWLDLTYLSIITLPSVIILSLQIYSSKFFLTLPILNFLTYFFITPYYLIGRVLLYTKIKKLKAGA